MSSPTQGMWVCRHNVDGRDFCPECTGPPWNEFERADQRDQMRHLLEEAMHLCKNGECAPGGDETWAEWFRKTETFLRALGAS